ncbi:GNAT family N-acetyltransferase [Luedemannella flava]|uniref:GNAT family N-acetyltransferase n=1 Tax=Luedemannella flava TaxID=349316 RepID=A0ABP4YZ38_9ACTN
MPTAQLTTRPYADADAEAVTDLLNEVDIAAGGQPANDVDETRAVIDSIVRDVARDTRVVVTGDGEIVAVGLVPTPPPGGFRVDLVGGVRPLWYGRGLGRELLDWQVERAREIHQAVAPQARWAVHADVLAGNDPAIRLYRRFGFTAVRHWFEMVADTSGDAGARAVAAPLPEGLALVPYSPGFGNDLYAAHMTAFEDHWGYQRRPEDEWRRLTVESATFLPALSRLALAGNRVAGYCLAYTDPQPHRVYVGHVGTSREWRRRGVASALLGAVLAAAGNAGAEEVVLNVDASSPTGAVGVYERAGFEVDSRGVTYALTLESRTAID